MHLRDYQESFATTLAQQFFSGKKKIVGQLPTGGGKTVVFSAITTRYCTKQETLPGPSRKGVLILVHRKELLSQTRRTLYKMSGITAFPIVAGKKFIPVSPAYVGMVETVFRRAKRLSHLNIGMVIIDEAHISAFNKLHEFFPGAMILGVTATPLAASRKNPMKNHYEDIVTSIDIPELIERGFLAQNITIAPKEVVNRAELKVKGNDFNEGMMGEKFSQPKYIQSTLFAYEKYGKGKKTIVFNATVEHSLLVTQAFKDAGYKCRHIDGTTPKHEREEAFEWLKQTPDAILCNVGIATTGFDEPTIELVIVNKATMSMPLWLQMTGRGGRIIDLRFLEEKQPEYKYKLGIKSSFTIIDMGGNAITHGDWCDPRDWREIFTNPPKPGKNQVAPVKSCTNCDAIIPAPARTCKYCGYEYPPIAMSVEDKVMNDFIVVTKNIDVNQIMEKHKERAEYLSFFVIPFRIAKEARDKWKKINDGIIKACEESLFDLCNQWCHAKGKKFNTWHREKAQIELHVQLAERFKEYQSPYKKEEYVKAKEPAAIAANPIPVINGPKLNSPFDLRLV